MTLRYPVSMNGRPDTDEPKRLTANAVPLTEERLAVLGHEIRNPLHALRFAIEVLSTTKHEPKLWEDLIQVMHRQVSQLTRLCDDLLDTGRMIRGSLTVDQTKIEIGKLILHAREQIQPFIEQCGHKLTLELSDSPLVLIGDASRLTQVFANLLHNSAKFTDRNGHLCVTLRKERDAAVISFRDNGRGLSNVQLHTLFTEDNSSESYPEANCSGLGIGLRLAKAIVDLHGGSLEAFSDGLGCGSTFVVRIPIATSDVSAVRGVASRSQVLHDASPPELPQMQIMVVDDDRSIRVLMSRILQDLNQSVTVAENGETALQKMLQERPHIVFVDLQMNGMTGLEMASLVRSHSDLDGVILIALSGNADAASRRLAAIAGFDQYLSKPTSSAALVKVLQQVGTLSKQEEERLRPEDMCVAKSARSEDNGK